MDKGFADIVHGKDRDMTDPGGIDSEVKTPIVIVERGDLMFFESVADTVGYLEGVDVDDGRYCAYDSEGRELRLTTVDEERPVLLGLLRTHTKRVQVHPPRIETVRSEKLRDELVAFLRRLDVPEGDLADSVPLSSILNIAISRASFTK